MISQTGNLGQERQDSPFKAFTLIELVLVILLIAVLAGLSTPLFRGAFQDLTLKDSSYNISKLINYGQEKAVIDRKNYKMTFVFSESKYWLSESDESDESPVYKKVAGRLGKVFVLPQGVSFNGSRNEIVLYPDGTCDIAEIELFNSKGAGYKISVKGFASRADIKEIKKK